LISTIYSNLGKPAGFTDITQTPAVSTKVT
jgi:hypothetical protein